MAESPIMSPLPMFGAMMGVMVTALRANQRGHRRCSVSPWWRRVPRPDPVSGAAPEERRATGRSTLAGPASSSQLANCRHRDQKGLQFHGKFLFIGMILLTSPCWRIVLQPRAVADPFRDRRADLPPPAILFDVSRIVHGGGTKQPCDL